MGTPSEQLKACASFLAENAEELTGQLFHSCTAIRVNIEMDAAEIPTIEVVKKFMPVNKITVAIPEND